MENRLRVELLITVCALLVNRHRAIARDQVRSANTVRGPNRSAMPMAPTLTREPPPSDLRTQRRTRSRNHSIGMPLSGTAQEVSVPGENTATVLVTLSSRPKARSGLSFTGTTISLDPGDVIRAGDSRSLFSLRGWNGFPEALERDAIRHGLTVSICYCSLLRTCWMKTWKAQLPSATALQDVEPYEIQPRCSRNLWLIAS